MAKKDAPEAVESGSKSKLIIMIAAGVLLLVAIGVGLFFYLNKAEPKLSPEEQQAELEKQSKSVGPMVNLDPFVVNILGEGETRFLKAAITVELDSERAALEVNERLPQIKDAILLLIGSKSFSEVGDLQGKLQLRAELINKLNGLLVNGRVKRIYFTDFVVQ